MQTSRLVAAAAVLVAAVGAYWFDASHRDSAPRTPRVHLGSQPVASEEDVALEITETGEARRTIAEGLQLPCRIYELEYATDTALVGEGGADQRTQLALGGELVLTVLGQDQEGRTTIELRLDEPRADVRADGVSSDDLTRSLQASLALPVRQRLDQDGVPVAYGLHPDVADQHRDVLRAVLAALRCELRDQDTWRAVEEDTTGRCEVEYTREGDTVRKQRLGYQDPIESARLAGQGAGEYLFDAGVLQSATWDEVTDVAFDGLGLEVHHRGRMTARLLSATTIGADELSSDEVFAWADSTMDEATRERMAQAAQTAAWSQRLAGSTLTSLVRDLTALIETYGPLSQEVATVREGLSWYLALHPESLAELRTTIEDSADPSLTGALLSATGGAQHEAAQELLAHFATRGSHEGLRLSALDSMFQLESPTPRTLKSAWSQAGKVNGPRLSTKSLLLAGALSGHVDPAQEQPEKPSALDELLHYESKAVAEGTLEAWLAALGNSKDPRVLPALERYATHKQAPVRTEALDAATRIPGVAARDLALSAWSHEREAPVRVDVGRALAGRADVPVSFAIDLTDASQMREIRLAGVGALKSRPEPEAAARLAELWNDPDEIVRKEVRGN